jgi:hypothetical protein
MRIGGTTNTLEYFVSHGRRRLFIGRESMVLTANQIRVITQRGVRFPNVLVFGMIGIGEGQGEGR